MADDRHPFSDPKFEEAFLDFMKHKNWGTAEGQELLRHVRRMLRKHATGMRRSSGRRKYAWTDPAVTLDDLVQEAVRRVVAGVRGFHDSREEFKRWMREEMREVLRENARRARGPSQVQPGCAS